MPAIPAHSTPVVDVPWDGPGSEAKIPNDAGESVLRRMYAWVDPDRDPNTKAAYKLSHHEVVNGRPGAANINGVRNALSRIPQMRPRLSSEDEAGVKAHLQGHIDSFDAQQRADAPAKDGVRALFDEPVHVRSEPDAAPVMYGHFAVYDQWCEINSAAEGHFFERFAPGSLKKTMQEGKSRMRVLFHHGRDPAVGFRVLGMPSVLEDEEYGAYYEVELFDAPFVHDLMPGIAAGAYGSSFRFRTIREDLVMRPRKSERNPAGLPERTVTEAAVPEFGPTPFQAYHAATAGMRSLTDDLLLDRLLESRMFVPRDLPTNGTVPADEPVGVTRYSPVVVSASLRASLITPDVPGADRTTAAGTGRGSHERALRFVSHSVWAMHPQAIELVMAIIAERASGHAPSDEELLERVGVRATEPDRAPSGVAVIRASGPIVPHAGMVDRTSSELTSVEKMQGQFRAAMGDPAVQHVLFNFDSPGGVVDLIPEFADEIRAARGEKPITAVANTWAGSGAYWLASQADQLVVTPSGEVGSIGVWSAHQDISAKQAAEGVNTTLISAGKYKIEGNPYAPLDEEAAAHLQDSVDYVYDLFLEAVAQGRGTDAASVREGFGEGRMVKANDAVRAGMADRVATFDQVLSELQTEPVSQDATPSDVAPSSGAVALSGVSHSLGERRGDGILQEKETKPSWRL